MRDVGGSAPNFEDAGAGRSGNWLLPPSPFAALLREAFSPSISDAEMACAADSSCEGFDAVMESWDYMVLEPFADRYALWGGTSFGERMANDSATALPF